MIVSRHHNAAGPARARIRGKGNRGTELAMVALLRRHGITGWRRHLPLFGRPDFVFRARRVALFVDGCFWHGCPRHANLPVNNRPFWRRKLDGNRRRDRLVDRTLRAAGWRVVRVWEHDLTPARLTRLAGRLKCVLHAGRGASEAAGGA